MKHLFYLDYSRRAAGTYVHREEFEAENLTEATRRALDFIPQVEAEFGTLDKVVVYGAQLDGVLILWKMVQDGAIVRLLVPAEARRIPAGMGTDYNWDQIKVEYAKVLNVYNSKGREIRQAASMEDPTFIYRVGEMAYPKNGYTHDAREYPSPGIYAYYTQEQARLHVKPLYELDDYRPIFAEFGRFLQQKAVRRDPEK